MHKTLLLLLLPALAAASHLPHLPRQTSSPDTSSCLAAIEAVGSTFPTIPEELVGMTDIEPITDPCNYTPLATMASAYSSFATVLLDWVSENWPKVTSAAEQCPEIASEVDGFARAWDLIVCTEQGPGATKTGADEAQPTATESVHEHQSSSGTAIGTLSRTQATGTGTAAAGAQSTTKSAAGARETGFVAGVVAAVGIIGAVVAL